MISTKYKIFLLKDADFRYETDPVIHPNQTVGILGSLLDGSDRENTVILAMNIKNEVIGVNMAFTGDISSCIFSVPELMRFVILSNGTGFIFAHNHPSGHLDPSENDKAVTKRIKDAAKIIGVEFLDHIIYGGDGKYLSMRAAGLL